MPSAGTLWINIAARTDRLTKGFRSVRKQLGAFDRYIAAAGIGAVAALARTSEGINQSMTRSLAIMGNVSDEMRDRMTRAAVEVSKTSQFSAKQAGEAYFFLASAGLDAQQSLAAMPQVARFAQAGNFDLALATDLVTDAQSALGLASKDAAVNLANMKRVTDVLVKANTLANASVEQFSTSLTTKAGAAIKVVGKDIEEGVAVLAALADQGVKSQDAGTALNIVFRDLQTKALQNAAAFRSHGIAVFDSTGEMRNMADVVGDMERALGGMSDAQKKATLLQLGFSDKSVSFIQVLLGTSEKIRNYEAALREAAGTTDMVADKSLTKMQKALNGLRGSWEEISATVGPFIVDAAANTANWVTATSEAASGASRLAIALGTIGDVVHTIGLAWKAWNALFDRIMANVIRSIERTVTAAVSQLNKLPGVNIKSPTGVQNAAISAEIAAEKSKSNLSEALLGKTPSEKIKAYFAKIKREAESAQESIGKTVEAAALPPKAHELLQKLGGGIASAAGVLTGAFSEGVKSGASALSSRGLGLPPALRLTQAGTAESYRQRVAISRQDETSKIAKQHFNEAKKQTNLLDLINRGLAVATPSNIFG